LGAVEAIAEDQRETHSVRVPSCGERSEAEFECAGARFAELGVSVVAAEEGTTIAL
jgi:hypothetical protein